jgi:hypothetical protein
MGEQRPKDDEVLLAVPLEVGSCKKGSFGKKVPSPAASGSAS